MGSFNNIIVSERSQRPSFNGKTILRAYFMRDGEYVSLDNSSVSSVTLFKKEANTSPSSILEASSGLITDSAASAAIWRWTLSGWENYNADTELPFPDFLVESDYTGTIGPDTSGIFKVNEGRLAVILDGTIDGSAILRDGTVVGSAANLSGEPAAPYIDVWTVKLCAGCEWVTFINDVAFFQNNAVVLSEPLMCSTRERLYNKRIELGSIEKLKIGTEITIENKNIDDSVKNVLRDGLITSGAVEVLKHNDVDRTLPAWAPVYAFSATASGVEISSDNTFLFTFDTNVLTDGSIPNLGNATGTYSIQLKYGILDETRLSPLMFFKVV
jgi:hypothetical protein